MKWPSLVREASSCHRPSTSRPMILSAAASGCNTRCGKSGVGAGPLPGQMLGGGAMNDIALVILPETADDAEAIERLHERTFGPGRYAKTAYRLREQVAHRPDLSFAARIGTLLVGS